MPLRSSVAAVSCGIAGGVPVLDLDYREDSSADVDMNVVMTGAEELVEVQATGEGVAFSREELDRLLELAAGASPRSAAPRTRPPGRSSCNQAANHYSQPPCDSCSPHATHTS